MKLLPIPGAPGYRVDCENQVAYRYNGFLKKVNDRTKYKTVNIMVDGGQFVTTVFRMMYCAQHGIDIRKIPKGVCIAMHNGIVMAVSRTDMSAKRLATVKARRKNMDQWRKNTRLIEQYYDGNTEPMLAELQHIEVAVRRWFVQAYGLCQERADIVAAHGVNKYLDRLAEGFPSPYIMGCVIRYARGENSRIAKQDAFLDNKEIIEI